MVAIGFIHIGLAEMLMNLYICKDIREIIRGVGTSSDITESGTTYLNKLSNLGNDGNGLNGEEGRGNNN